MADEAVGVSVFVEGIRGWGCYDCEKMQPMEVSKCNVL